MLLRGAESCVRVLSGTLLAPAHPHQRATADERERLAQLLERRLGVRRCAPAALLEQHILPGLAAAASSGGASTGASTVDAGWRRGWLDASWHENAGPRSLAGCRC